MYNSKFQILDYILFCVSLCMPVSICIYFGCFSNKHNSGKEYLYGKQNFNAWTVGLSLFSGTISSIAIVGTVSEVYVFGSQFMMVAIGSLLSLLIVWYFILPVFVGNLNLESPYEYFQLRFDKKIRIFMSILSTIHSISFMSAVLYASTFPFSEATNIPLEICTSVVGISCTIYTLIGGFVGVIWTNVIQASLIFLSCLFVMFKGVNESGGITNVFKIADEGHRLEFFNFDPNPFERLTFWSAVLGMMVLHVAFSGCSPSALQRFMAVNTEKGARISSMVATGGFSFLILITGIIALSIYARYKNCDPISNHDITSSSQILSYFINDIAKNIPGFTGFFNAGLLSAGLSSISADMNVVSGIIYYDFVPKSFRSKNNKLREVFIMKISVLIFGIIIMILCPIFAKSKYFYLIVLSICSLCYGAITGVIILGTSVPICNTKGVLMGILSSLVVVGTLTFCTISLDSTSNYALSVSTTSCIIHNKNFTTIAQKTINNNEEIPILYKLSFMYYNLLGVLVTILVAVAISFITGKNNIHTISPHLIIPFFRVKTKENIEMAIMSN